MRRSTLRAFTLSAVTVLIACMHMAYGQQMIDRVVAVVGSEIILLSDVQQEMRKQMINRNMDNNTNPDVLRHLQEQVINGMIDDRLLLEKALIDSVEADPRHVDQVMNQFMSDLKNTLGTEEKYQEALDENGFTEQQLRHMFRETARKNVIQEMLLDNVRRGISVTPQEMEQWVATHRDSLPEMPEQFKLSHIMLVPKMGEERKKAIKDKLTAIRERVLAGEDFAELAREYSEDPGTASDGGLIPYFPRGVMVEEFTQAAFALANGEISDVIETDFGFHIIKMEDKKFVRETDGRMVEKAKVRHILLQAQINEEDNQRAIERLKELREQVISGKAKFEDLAKEYSEDEHSSVQGGRIQWQTGSQLSQTIPEFYEAASKMKPGDISEPIKSKFGYHILKLEQYRPQHVLNVMDDRTVIENQIMQEKTIVELERVLAELRGDTYIDIRME